MTLGHRMPTAFLRQVDIWPQTWKPKLTVSSQRIWWMLKFCFMLELSSLYTMLTCSAAATSRQSSPTVRPYRRQPIRLLCPWDSPGKNTGAGCHFLLQCMKVKSEREVAQSCPTLCNSMDCSPPGCSVRGISEARVLEWGVIAFSRHVLNFFKTQQHRNKLKSLH